jgi:hypothetical protein
MLIATIALISEVPNDMRLIDGLIFYGICIGFILIHKYRETILDKNSQKCSIIEQNLFTKTSNTVSLSDIEGFEMSYGRGSGNARGGVLYMRVKDNKKFHIIDSDVQLKHEQKTMRAKNEIESFL